MATLKDVARLAKVSITTVSRALNGHSDLIIPESTKARIMRAVEEVGYVRPRVSRKEPSLKRVGIVAFKNEKVEATDQYFYSIRRGIENECRARGLFGAVSLHWADLLNLNETFSETDGIIVVGENLLIANYLRENPQIQKPVVFVDRCPDPTRFNSVVVDFTRSTFGVLDHLIGLGHKAIGFFGGPAEYGVDPRLEAFRLYLQARGIFQEKHVHLGDWFTSTAYELARRVVLSGNLASAYFVGSDPMAIGVIRALSEAGLRIPEDVAIVSFDDVDIAEFVTPSLTTVHVPTKDMGREAVNLLLRQFGSWELPLQVTIPTRLIVRESCGSLKNLSDKSVLGEQCWDGAELHSMSTKHA